MKQSFKIGEISKQAGVGIETIRFYERNGLIAEPPRRESGYREYSSDVVTRLKFIRRAKELGFSLKEISYLLSLRPDSRIKCGEIKKRASEKILEIDSKIRDLRRMRKALMTLSENCSRRPTTQDCPIVVSLESATDKIEKTLHG